MFEIFQTEFMQGIMTAIAGFCLLMALSASIALVVRVFKN